MTKRQAILFLVLLALLIGVAIGFFAGVRCTAPVPKTRMEKVREATNWITRKELDRIRRYHGTDALRIDEEKVAIWREGKWIDVRWREEGT